MKATFMPSVSGPELVGGGGGGAVEEPGEDRERDQAQQGSLRPPRGKVVGADGEHVAEARELLGGEGGVAEAHQGAAGDEARAVQDPRPRVGLCGGAAPAV